MAILASAGIATAAVAADGGIDVWWPTDGASVQGTQPFKALVSGKNVGDYSMYWSVDGGGLVPMSDDYRDYPHKEYSVDLSGWTWNGDGSYRVSFIAKDKGGAEIARKTVTIKNEAQRAASAPAPVQRTVTVSSPSEGARLSGTATVRAWVAGLDLSSYKMYWSVDGGGLVEMSNSGSAKEYAIDFSGWTWKGDGAYAVTFTAKDSSGAKIADKTVSIYANSSQGAAQQSAPSPTASSAIAPVTSAVAAVVNTVSSVTNTVATVTNTVSSALSTLKLYVDPFAPAIAQANSWQSSRPADAEIMRRIGSESTGIWLGGWNADVAGDVKKVMESASKLSSVPTFVAYNIPNRDCGSYSAGGLDSKESYLSWIRKVASGIGSGSAIVILEPDAISLTDCLSDQAKSDRYSMLSSAVEILSANKGTKVYVDAGHAGWIDAAEMGSRLAKAGVSKAAGFSLNVSNFGTTDENVAYGDKVSKAAGGARYVVDTSRNGNGSNGEWCNPSGRALGKKPTLATGYSLVDAFLWVKKPGESDGWCNGGPSAGTWWPEYALELAKRAGY